MWVVDGWLVEVVSSIQRDEVRVSWVGRCRVSDDDGKTRRGEGREAGRGRVLRPSTEEGHQPTSKSEHDRPIGECKLDIGGMLDRGGVE